MPKKITIQPIEFWDEKNERFIVVDKPTDITIEHSLVSISKWEAKWKKAYLTNKQKSGEELLDYIKCMTITQNVDDKVYLALNKENIEEISEYINDSMSATVFPSGRSASAQYSRDTITSEMIYYLMASNNIPIEFQKWHLNRLLTLLKIFEVKNAPHKKMSKRELISNYASINAANKAKFHTKG